MNNDITATAKIIPFRKKELLLVDHDGAPFVPMKPVVEGMGLDWKSQHVKLQGGRFNSCMVIITMQLPGDSQRREVACLPLRKLAGWLMSIHAGKVRPDLRDNVIAYQNECDDALWSYWNDGIAVRSHSSNVASVLNATIGTDGFHVLGSLVAGKVRSLPAQSKRRATMKLWAQVHAAFSVRSAEDIPMDQLDSARNFIAAYALEGEWLKAEKPEPVPVRPLNIHWPLECLTGRREGMLAQRSEKHDTLTVSLHDIRENFTSPVEMILSELSRNGYAVDAAWWEIRTYRNKLERLRGALDTLNYTFDSPQEYVVQAGGKRVSA